METTFAYRITRLKRNFMDYCSARLEALDLTLGLMFFLIYVGNHPGASPSTLSSVLTLDMCHTSRSIDKLVGMSYLERTRNETDKRGQSLCLTTSGEAAYVQIKGFFGEWDHLVLSELSLEQRGQLCQLMDLVLEATDDGTVFARLQMPPNIFKS